MVTIFSLRTMSSIFFLFARVFERMRANGTGIRRAEPSAQKKSDVQPFYSH